MTSTLQGTPALLAASATPWAALPALTVQTPSPPLLFGQQSNRIVGAANLERSDRLQALQLQIDFGGCIVVQTHQRRADRRFVDMLAGIVDHPAGMFRCVLLDRCTR